MHPLPPGHLALSGEIAVGSLDGGQRAAKHPMVHRTVPTTKNDPTTNLKSARVENLWLKITCSESSQDPNFGLRTPSTVLMILLQKKVVSYPLLVPVLVIGSPFRGESGTFP